MSSEGSDIHSKWNLRAKDRPLFSAIYRNNAAAVKRSIRRGANVKCYRNSRNRKICTSPLMEACRYGHDKIVRILLDAGANARWKDSKGWSAIANAVSKGHLSIVELLIKHNKNLMKLANNLGNTPLLLAVNYHRVDIVRFLLDRGANVHAANQDGRTALMIACEDRGNMTILRLLLTAGVDVNARDDNHKTALHHAARFASLELMCELVREHNANMLAVDKDGNTPFDWMSHRPDNRVVDQFMETYGYKMTQDHGSLALHAILGVADYSFAIDYKHHPPLKPSLQIRLPLGTLTCAHFRYLLSTLDTNLIRNRDDNGKLPIHVACLSNAPVEVLSILVEIDAATLRIADHAGGLPLHECCCGVVDDFSVRYLLEIGGVGTLAARTRKGALPLHLLCGSTNPSLQLVQYLIQSFPGAVTARTNAGYYPFVIAACESSTASLSVVYDLVRANPDLVIPN